jgi:hypothetical protein
MNQLSIENNEIILDGAIEPSKNDALTPYTEKYNDNFMEIENNYQTFNQVFISKISNEMNSYTNNYSITNNIEYGDEILLKHEREKVQTLLTIITKLQSSDYVKSINDNTEKMIKKISKLKLKIENISRDKKKKVSYLVFNEFFFK